MNAYRPTSGHFYPSAVSVDPAGRLHAPGGSPDWARLGRPVLLPAPYALPGLRLSVRNEGDPASDAKLVNLHGAEGRLWAAGSMNAPPAHPSLTDPMQEIAVNTLHNRVEQLWGVLSIHRVEKSGPHEDHDNDAASRIWALILLYFETFPNAEGVRVQPSPSEVSLPTPRQYLSLNHLPQWSKAMAENRPLSLAVTRDAFWASSPPGSFHLSPWAPIERPLTHGPPPKPFPGTVVYKRFIPALNKILRYRMVDDGPSPRPPSQVPDGKAAALPFHGEDTDATGSFGGDVPLFAMWQNSDRVNAGWRQRGPLKEHWDFVHECVVDEHRWGLIGTWASVHDDGKENPEVKWGYVEVCRPIYSNIARWALPNDMGIHALVGDNRYRGRWYVRTWLGAAVHLAFLLNPRAERCLSEPRASNTKMVGYECLVGGQVERLIDLGHKRSALVVWNRDGFFQLSPMGPLLGDVPENLDARQHS